MSSAFYNSNSPSKSYQEFTRADADMSAFEAVYVARIKASVSQVLTKMGDTLKDYSISVREITGNINFARKQIERTQALVTIREKWDTVLEKWRAYV